MAKSGNKNTTKAKKDKVQAKSGTGAIVKAKEKRKKKTAALKKVLIWNPSTMNTCWELT